MTLIKTLFVLQECWSVHRVTIYFPFKEGSVVYTSVTSHDVFLFLLLHQHLRKCVKTQKRNVSYKYKYSVFVVNARINVMTLVCMCMFFSVTPLHSMHRLQHTLGNNWRGEPVCSGLFFNGCCQYFLKVWFV